MSNIAMICTHFVMTVVFYSTRNIVKVSKRWTSLLQSSQLIRAALVKIHGVFESLLNLNREIILYSRYVQVFVADFSCNFDYINDHFMSMYSFLLTNQLKSYVIGFDLRWSSISNYICLENLQFYKFYKFMHLSIFTINHVHCQQIVTTFVVVVKKCKLLKNYNCRSIHLNNVWFTTDCSLWINLFVDCFLIYRKKTGYQSKPSHGNYWR